MIKPLDREALRAQFRNAQPFPFIMIDDFLLPEAAAAVAAAYPSFEQARELGFTFNFVNEQRKVQITDATRFPEPVRLLNEAISSPAFLADLEYISGIPRIVVDEQLLGGGMHLTGSGGRLDVHVDFNLIEERQLFRRLNILLYLNPVWREEWGGQIELWDKEVKACRHRCLPALNRCLLFETSAVSYHGVARVTAPSDVTRQSFAAYYYTREAPPNWNGTTHSTVFKARPDERLRGLLRMPAEKLKHRIFEKVQQSKSVLKTWIGRR
jgi:hypothetical protein